MNDSIDRQAFYRDIFDGGCATQILWGLRGVVNELFIREPLYKNELVKGEVVRKVYDEIWRLDINKLRSKYPHLTHLMDSKYDDIGNIAVTKNDTEESVIGLSVMRIDAGEELLAGVIRKWEEELEKGGQLKFNLKQNKDE
jgi:hypothetical protein